MPQFSSSRRKTRGATEGRQEERNTKLYKEVVMKQDELVPLGGLSENIQVMSKSSIQPPTAIVQEPSRRPVTRSASQERQSSERKRVSDLKTMHRLTTPPILTAMPALEVRTSWNPLDLGRHKHILL